MSSGDEERAAVSKHHHRDKDKKRDHSSSSSRRHRDKDRSSSRHHRDERDGERERDRDPDRHHGGKERDREERKAREQREKEEKKERERERRREERDREKEKEKSRRREAVDEEEDEDRDRKRRRRSSRHHHHRDAEPEAAPLARAEEEEDDGEEAQMRRQKKKEEDMEAEQQQLDDEMERRRRRVKEWQEKKRREQQLQDGSSGAAATADADGEGESGKKWTLDGEESDEEDANKLDEEDAKKSGENGGAGSGAMDVDTPNLLGNDGNSGADMEEDEIDPLDAFMNSMVLPEVAKLESAAPAMEIVLVANAGGMDDKDDADKKAPVKGMGRIMQGDDSDSDYDDSDNNEAGSDDEDDAEFMKRVKKTKAEKLVIVDHSKIDYQPFRKNFYIEVKDITRMSAEEVAAYRKLLEIKVHGKDVPKPIKMWIQSGLTSKLLDTIKKLGFEKPMPIQAQALPIIMSGRDCIGVAKTGSGKTLAFVLPMLRHVKDQPPVVPGDGPIGLIMAPTRELVLQIYSDIKKFSKVLGINCVPIYGGSGVAQQISELKRGAEIVVCTPGRMIDILCTSSGKITNLRRVSFLVLDEADRMFDMGFEPQITRIVQNTRPDRQTVLFSATFPRQVEILARKVLTKPVEVLMGGRSVVNKDITQLVEVRPDSERFFRLLELLGEWFTKGKILVFVHSQEKCDSLLKELFQHGYPCLSLHGGKDQNDRESTLADFKSNVCNLLIATSVAARGLDVKDLEIVVNYDVTNHYEDYVHRVGRTGRAGRKGCAVTFISEEEERYAPDLVKALELSEQAIPEDLKALADRFMSKVRQGTEQAHGTGYGGSGFKFNREEEEARQSARRAQGRAHGYEDNSDSGSEEEGGVHRQGDDVAAQSLAAAQAAALAVARAASIANQQATAAGSLLPLLVTPNQPNNDATERALDAARNLAQNLARIQGHAVPEHYDAELEINDFPQNARWKITHKDTLGPIQEWTGAAITTRGTFIPQGRIVGANERKLYLYIEGPNESSVKKAKAELKRVLEDCANHALNLPGSAQTGKYVV
ncbi:DEAD-box ATP-dependent RNA helicase 42-like [Lolium rigidum]|uniref:DEAD-box ATP-dependent RNA helicase 42-like n=1 Tax=Lolium rigidum TaxID=89674 RepID=UPI001F5C1C64|nr:DEAD-box ATP-dependent RNA helicase 42-like [Lolium rigidum]